MILTTMISEEVVSCQKSRILTLLSMCADDNDDDADIQRISITVGVFFITSVYLQWCAFYSSRINNFVYLLTTRCGRHRVRPLFTQHRLPANLLLQLRLLCADRNKTVQSHCQISILYSTWSCFSRPVMSVNGFLPLLTDKSHKVDLQQCGFMT